MLDGEFQVKRRLLSFGCNFGFWVGLGVSEGYIFIFFEGRRGGGASC